MNFSIVKKGYDKEEVDKYINNINKGFEISNGELRIRISDLNCEIDKLKQKIQKYEEQEDLIKNVIIKAQEKADEIEYASKIRFALEGERLKVFKEKWLNNFRPYANKNKTNWEKEIKDYFDNLYKDVEIMLKENFKVEDYLNEAEEDFNKEVERLEK